MSSNMTLRACIRPPARFGEAESETPTAALLQSMRQAREEGTDHPQTLVELTNSAKEVVVRQRAPKRKPQSVPYDASLPPAVFPSLIEPRPNDPDKPGRNDKARHPQRGNGNNQDNRVGMSVEECLPLGEIENYAASNSPLNPVYVGNMKAMAASNQHNDAANCDFTDSDLDESVDDSVFLGANIPNPAWSNLNPALQVEIVENLLKTASWRTVCSKLGLGADDVKMLVVYLDTRNKQIVRENQRLDTMRQKQLRALMRIDNSDIKSNNVPHQLVLRRISRSTTRRILSDQRTDLLMCRAADVLAARQYLHRRSLDRSSAGDWGHSLVVLREPEHDHQAPEQFEWKKDLSLSPELAAPSSLPDRPREIVGNAKNGFQLRIGRRKTVCPAELIRRPGERSPVRDWRRQFPIQFPDWRPVSKKPIPKKPKIDRSSKGMVRLNVGLEKAAQIREYEERGIPVKRAPPAQQSSPLAPPIETPSRVHFGPKTRAEANADLFPAPRTKNGQKPVTRSLGGAWSLNLLNPSASQARFISKINAAQIEAEQQRMRARADAVGPFTAQQRAVRHAVISPSSPVQEGNVAEQMVVDVERLSTLENLLSPTPLVSRMPVIGTELMMGVGDAVSAGDANVDEVGDPMQVN